MITHPQKHTTRARRGTVASFVFLGLLAAGLSVGALGCPADVGDRCAESACTRASGDGGNGPDDGSNVPDVVKPANCNDQADSTDGASIPCIDDTYAVFVDPVGGKDTNAGSKQAPVQTINTALAKRNGKPRIYLCGEGPFQEHIELKSSVLLLGGFTCEAGAWTYKGTRARVAPADEGYALHIDGVKAEVRISDVAFESMPGGTKSATSVAAFVVSADNVSLRRVLLRAGAGAQGGIGSAGAAHPNYANATATVGGNALGATAGAGASCTCLDTKTKSTGGNGMKGDGSGVQPGTADPSVGMPNSGGSPDSTTCSVGKIGAHGLATTAGAASNASGKLTEGGWDTSFTDVFAPNGNPAHGGGGGGARQDVAAPGGGGGCGGCGGAGGGLGQMGGSSFALLSFKSTIALEDSELTTSAGGKGGKGGPGQPGQMGGSGGASAACGGGPGGNGAGGSGGGGGVGGHSIPVVFVGNEPKLQNTKVTPGPKGPAGDGGDGGSVSPGNAGTAGSMGVEGKSQNSLSL